MPKSAATVKRDDDVLDAVRREAARSGRSADQVVEAAVRRYVGPSVLDRLRERNRLVDVVLDVNIFVSAVVSGAGPSAQLVAAIRDDRLSVVVCPALLAELGGVLRRDRFRRYLSLDEVDQYTSEIEGLCRMVDDPDPVPAVLRDPDDDYLVALASVSGPARSSPATSTSANPPAYRCRCSLREMP